MCEHCDTLATYSDIQLNISQYDPTRTLTLRNAFVLASNKRFKQLKRLVTYKVSTLDYFGLKTALNTNAAQQNVESFIKWLEQTENRTILDRRWVEDYIRLAYQRGIERARAELRKLGIDTSEADAQITNLFGEKILTNLPYHVDNLGILFSRTFTELSGITNEMNTQIVRIISEGLVQGDSPVRLARKINTAIIDANTSLGLDISYVTKTGKTVSYFMSGRRRAEILARTEVIRAHHMATIQEYKRWGIYDVKVLAEFATAKDERVCVQCASLEGTIWTLDEAMTLIPVHPQCFIDRQIPIYTSKGWKQIGDIVKGDKVLTHKGRFRNVTALIQNKQKTEVIRFKFKGDLKLSMTSNHPVLVYRNNKKQWIRADECTVEDTLFIMSNRCKRCGVKIPYFRTYCSHSCLSKNITDKQWSDPKHRENMSKKTSLQLKREYEAGIRDKKEITKKANKKTRQIIKDGNFHLNTPELRELMKKVTNTPELRKRSSDRMKIENPMFKKKIRKKAKKSLMDLYKNHPEKRLNTRMAKHRKSGRKTSIERKMASFLDALNIKYVFQYPILRYNVDFAIPDLKIVIECDGTYWHKDQVEQDYKRQCKIEKEGWTVLRYTDIDFKNRGKSIQNELSRILSNHANLFLFTNIKIEKIEKYSMKKERTTYNFSVEEDESYVAKGIVVHNCRCVALPFIDKS